MVCKKLLIFPGVISTTMYWFYLVYKYMWIIWCTSFFAYSIDLFQKANTFGEFPPTTNHPSFPLRIDGIQFTIRFIQHNDMYQDKNSVMKRGATTTDINHKHLPYIQRSWWLTHPFDNKALNNFTKTLQPSKYTLKRKKCRCRRININRITH